jgi:YbbR domain-containing protein
MLSILHWLGKNFGTLLTSFILAIAVWITAVTDADPNEKRTLSYPVPIEIIGQDPGLIQVGDHTQQVSITLSAPRSVWTKLSANDKAVSALVDLSGFGPGTHNLPIQVQIATRPVRIISVYPETLTLTLETLVNKTLPIKLITQGEPAIGYQMGNTSLSHTEATLTGPESSISRVKTVRASLSIAQSQENIKTTIPLEALDANNNIVSGLTLSPDKVTVAIPITQLGGYRDMVVKVSTIGQVANGYRLTNISVSPPAVTVFSTDPKLVNELPGYIETLPLNLNNARDDLDLRLELNLPAGISVVGNQSVLVQVGVAAIESSITLSQMKIGMTNLYPNYVAQISPEAVDIILSGPLPILEKLAPSDIKVVLDLHNLTAGKYQIHPDIISLPDQVSVQSILPETVEVTILSAADARKTPKPQG